MGVKLPAWFENASRAAVIASLLEYSVGTVGDLSPLVAATIGYLAVVLRIGFGVEYAVRIAVAPRRFRYIRSPLGIIDLAAVAVDFGPLKLLRVAKLLGRSGAYLRIRGAILAVKRDLALTLLAAMVLIYAAAVGIYYCERHIQPEAFGSIPASLWWAVITLTTIGYGDVSPVTPIGKALTSFVALLGLGLVAIPTGLLAAALMKGTADDRG